MRSDRHVLQKESLKKLLASIISLDISHIRRVQSCTVHFINIIIIMFFPFYCVQNLVIYDDSRVRLSQNCVHNPFVDATSDDSVFSMLFPKQTRQQHYCLSNALHSSIRQNIKSHTCPLSVVHYPVSGVWSECEKLQITITQQRVIRLSSCLDLGWFF